MPRPALASTGPGGRHHDDDRPAPPVLSSSISREDAVSAPTTTPATTPPDRAKAVQQPGDRIFAGHRPRAPASSSCVVLAGVAAFLIVQALPALLAPADQLPGGQSLVAYIGPLIFGTLLSAFIALLIATPLAVAVALFITHYAPRRLAQGLGYLIDLLAAVPSIVFGLWGVGVLAPASLGLMTWLYNYLGWIPLFAGPVSATGRTMLVVGRDAGRDDPADHHGGLPRGVPADAPAARGGRARAGRHALGDDPHGGAAVRPLRDHQRRDARAGPRARRDDGRRDHPVRLGRHHVQPDQLEQPVLDRGEHRAAVPRLHRASR